MRNMSNEERFRISIRVNRDLLEEIRQLAQRDNRSINSYVLNAVHHHAQAQKTADKRRK